jgi:hypothetical protein
MAKNKYRCGLIIPSSCVPFSGEPLTLTSPTPLDCDANIDDVIEKIDVAVKELQDATNVGAHTASCITLPSIKTPATILQAHADKICALAASIDTLNQLLAAQDIASDLVTIDLGCLASAASPCQVSTNTYSLISILTLFKNEICTIKTSLGI